MASKRRTGETIEEWLHRIIVRNPGITVDELAEELGVRPNDLYEWGNINQPRRFPLSLLLPLMRATKNTNIIEHLAAQMGMVIFKIRKRSKSRLESAEDIQEYLQQSAKVLKSIIDTFKNRNKIDTRITLKELDQFMSTLAGLRDDIENLSDQLDLRLEE
ncbi:hypothetical protein ES703_86428 [subsurface metagenome]